MSGGEKQSLSFPQTETFNRNGSRIVVLAILYVGRGGFTNG